MTLSVPLPLTGLPSRLQVGRIYCTRIQNADTVKGNLPVVPGSWKQFSLEVTLADPLIISHKLLYIRYCMGKNRSSTPSTNNRTSDSHVIITQNRSFAFSNEHHIHKTLTQTMKFIQHTSLLIFLSGCHGLSLESRRSVIGWMASASAGLIAANANAVDTDVDSFLRSGMVSMPMGVSGKNDCEY